MGTEWEGQTGTPLGDFNVEKSDVNTDIGQSRETRNMHRSFWSCWSLDAADTSFPGAHFSGLSVVRPRHFSEPQVTGTMWLTTLTNLIGLLTCSHHRRVGQRPLEH